MRRPQHYQEDCANGVCRDCAGIHKPACRACGDDGLVHKLGVSGVVTDFRIVEGVRLITGFIPTSVAALRPNRPCDCDTGWAIRLKVANADDGGP